MSAISFFNREIPSSDDSPDSMSDFIVSDEEEIPVRPSKRSRPLRHPTLKRGVDGLIQMNTQERTIFGRDSEVTQILSLVLQGPEGMRPLLLGPRGIGKCSIVEKAMGHPRLKDRKIYLFDCCEEVAKQTDESFLSSLKQKMEEIVHFFYEAPNRSYILYLRHIEKLVQLDHFSEYMHTFLTKPLVVIGSIDTIGNEEKIEKAVSFLGQYNFFPITVKESSVEVVQQIISERLEAMPTVAYTKEGKELGVRLAAKHFSFQPLPNRALHLLQECAVWHSLQEQTPRRRALTPIQVARFFSERTGIRADELRDDSLFNAERFVNRLSEKIVGQDYAIRKVASRIASAKMGVLDPKRPWGAFLFVGHTGVGKTELAKQLSEELFHNEGNLIVLDGSEYIESHTVSSLLGSPSGYADHDSEGKLTGPLLENPYQVVLFDEVEKAHDDVIKLFLQVFDHGWLTDRQGKKADCTKAIFIMTSNLGSESLLEASEEEQSNPKKIISLIKPNLIKKLSQELCGRFSKIVPFIPINRENFYKLAEVQLKRKKGYLKTQSKIDLEWTQEVVYHLSNLSVDLEFGARYFCRQVDKKVEKAIKEAFLYHNQRIEGKVTLTLKTEEGKEKVSAL